MGDRDHGRGQRRGRVVVCSNDQHCRDHPSGCMIILAGNIISFSYHAYQQELFPTGIRARAVGFVYSWSRFSAIFTAFIISWLLEHFGVPGVFAFIAGAMFIVMLDIGLLGPRTKDVALEKISH